MRKTIKQNQIVSATPLKVARRQPTRSLELRSQIVYLVGQIVRHFTHNPTAEQPSSFNTFIYDLDLAWTENNPEKLEPFLYRAYDLLEQITSRT